MKGKKILSRVLSLYLALTLACILFPLQILQAEKLEPEESSKRDVQADGKTWPAQEVVEIHTTDDLLTFAGDCSVDAWSADKRVVLKEDIDLSGTVFGSVPVFAGDFDGEGHTIFGFQHGGDGYVAGLFRYIQKNGCVKNLKLEGEVTASDEKECIGGLCGVNYGKILSCSFKGTVNGKTTVGGLAGVNEGTGIIQDSSVKGRVTGYFTTGGLVGKNHGTVSDCVNRASVNHNSGWVEEADEMGKGIFQRIVTTESDVKLFSDIDSGGIAGCSDGVIIGCKNYGKIGYEHTGYNVGGIAGRQSGVVSLCTNEGTVYGRKDIGGLVGQMEPYIEVNEAETLRNAVNKLHGLIEKTADDMGNGKNALKSDLDALTVYSDGAVDAGTALAGQITDMADENMDQAQAIMDRLDHVTGMLAGVFDDAYAAEKSFSKASRILGRIGGRLEDMGDSVNDLEDELKDSADRLAEAQKNANAIIQEIQSSPSISADRLKDLRKTLAELSDAAAAVMDSLNKSVGRVDQQFADRLKAVEVNLNRLAEVQQRVAAIIQSMLSSPDISASRLHELQGALAELSDAAAAVMSSLNKSVQQIEGNLKDAGDELKKLIAAQEKVSQIIQSMQNGTNNADNLGELQKALAELSKAAADVIEKLEKAAGEVSRNEELNHILGEVKENQEKLNETLNNVNKIIQEIEKNPDTEQLTELAEQLSKLIADTAAIIKSTGDAVNKMSELAAEQRKGMESDLKELADAQKKVNECIKNMQSSPDISADSLKKLQEALSELSETAAEILKKLNGGTGQQPAAGLEAVKNDLNRLVQAQQRVHTIIQSMQGGINISADRVRVLQGALFELSDVLSSVINSLSSVMDSVRQYAEDSLKDMKDHLGRLTEVQQRVNAMIQEMQSGMDVSADRLIELQQAFSELSDAAADAISSLNQTTGSAGRKTADSLKGIGNDLSKAMDYMYQALDSVKSATKDAKSMIDYVNGQEDIHFSKLGAAFDTNRENLHDQLKGMSGCIRNLSNDASSHSDVVNEDLKAVNDQLNIVFNLLADHLTNYEIASVEELYEDVDVEDTDSITAGKTDNCVNKGIVKGDINVGGIAGAMSIDEEDPEESAAGSVEYQMGSKFFTQCLIANCVNKGYVTAKKDGAGGIVGHMRHGIVVDSEGYGSVESTEGNYVGGICGESLTVIKRCYALCSVSGGKNIGGIAGSADTLKDCYAITDCHGTLGRTGAIAGQTAYYDDTLNEEKVSGNYYVGDDLYGIDNISYAGVAEPISYEELLKAEKLPEEFRHLKVTFRVDGLELGTQEIPFGESLSKLEYPAIPEKEGYYGVWPDYSGEVMKYNLLINGEYKEDVTVVQSNETYALEGVEKPYALAEQRFTEDTLLKVNLSDAPVPDQILRQDHVTYNVTLERAEIPDSDTFAVRLYNPYEKASVWGCKNGIWTELESKERGEYLQVDMAGTEEMFCVASSPSREWMIFAGIAGGAAVLVLFLTAKKRRRVSN